MCILSTQSKITDSTHGLGAYGKFSDQKNVDPFIKGSSKLPSGKDQRKSKLPTLKGRIPRTLAGKSLSISYNNNSGRSLS